MKVRKFLLVLGLAMATTFASAQSATDIELAKQLAKQQGYSDAQIEAMMNQYNNKGNQDKSGKQNTNCREREFEELFRGGFSAEKENNPRSGGGGKSAPGKTFRKKYSHGDEK